MPLTALTLAAKYITFPFAAARRGFGAVVTDRNGITASGIDGVSCLCDDKHYEHKGLKEHADD